MSRSRRHTPKLPHTTAISDKRDKVLAHRAERTAVRNALAVERDFPGANLFGDPWKAGKDGKHYVVNARPEWMRK